MQNRLDYQLHNNKSLAGNSQSEVDLLQKENKKLREEAYSKDEKSDILFNFLLNMQHSLLNKSSGLPILQNVDIITLRSKINEIQDEVYDLIYKRNKTANNSNPNPASNFNFSGENNNNNFNGTMRSMNSNQIKNIYGLRDFKELSEENEKIR